MTDKPPTFDEWYEANHKGYTFEATYMGPTSDPKIAFKMLTRELRDYVSEMVKK